MGEKCSDKFWPRIQLPRNSRDLLHAANLRHGMDGFISPPKEGVLRIFSPLKIQELRPGLNPRTWVPKASTQTPRPPKPLRLSQKNSCTKIYEDSNLLGQHKMSHGKHQYLFEILVITYTVKQSNGTNQDSMESQTFTFSYTATRTSTLH